MSWSIMGYYREVDRLENQLLAIGFQPAHIRALKRDRASDFIFAGELARRLVINFAIDPDKVTVALLFDADLVAQEPTEYMVNALNDTLKGAFDLFRLRGGILKDEIRKVIPFLK